MVAAWERNHSCERFFKEAPPLPCPQAGGNFEASLKKRELSCVQQGSSVPVARNLLLGQGHRLREDSFCNKETGLTCTGKPEVPLRGLMDKGVTTVILHTGESDAETMCQKLAQTDPNLISYKVSASDTAKKVIAVLEDKVQVQPLTYVLKPLRLEDHPPQGQLLCDSIRVSDVASGHDLEVAVGKEKTTHSIGADGLLFVGKSSQNPMITLSRPVDKDLDGWFEDKSLEAVPFWTNSGG